MFLLVYTIIGVFLFIVWEKDFDEVFAETVKKHINEIPDEAKWMAVNIAYVIGILIVVFTWPFELYVSILGSGE